MLQRVRKSIMFYDQNKHGHSHVLQGFLWKTSVSSTKRTEMEKVERKRKTDRDLYDTEVVEVDTMRQQLKIHFVGLSHEYDEWRDNYLR